MLAPPEQRWVVRIALVELAGELGVDDAKLRDYVHDHPSSQRYLVVARASTTPWASMFLAIDMNMGLTTMLKISRRGVEHEPCTMARAKHLHVAGVDDVFVHADYVTSAIQWCNQGTLDDYASTHGWRQVLARAIEAGFGLAHLHGLGLVHGDIRTTNLLVAHECGLLSDFGTARPEGSCGGLSRAGDTQSFVAAVAQVMKGHDDVPARIFELLDVASSGAHARRPALDRLLADLDDALDEQRGDEVWQIHHVSCRLRRALREPKRESPELRTLRRDIELARRRLRREAAVMITAAAIMGGVLGGMVGVTLARWHQATLLTTEALVQSRLELAVQVVEEEDIQFAVLLLESAARHAGQDSEFRALRKTAFVAELLGYRFATAGMHDAARHAWAVAFDCSRAAGDEVGARRIRRVAAQVPEQLA
jgi:tRNA A-37 threonylcarbamoyl transferase component Bud32